MPDSRVEFGKRGAPQPASRPERAPQHRFVKTPPAFEAGASAIEAKGEGEAPKRGDAASAETDLKLYFGDDWPQFAPLWRSMDGGAWRPSWSFKAALLAGNWLLYRKQSVGFAFVIAYALLGSVGSSWEAYAILINAICCVFIGLFGRSIVINGALRTIARIRALHGAGPYADGRIGRAGGASWLLPLIASLMIFNGSYLIERQTQVDAAVKPGISDSR